MSDEENTSERTQIPQYDARREYMDVIGKSMAEIHKLLHRDMIEQALIPLRHFYSLVRSGMSQKQRENCNELEQSLMQMQDNIRSREQRKQFREKLIEFHRIVLENAQSSLVPVTVVKEGEDVDAEALMDESRS